MRGLTSSPLLPRIRSKSGGSIHLPPFYHDIRHLPGYSKSHILLCKESTSGIISEDIYMIGLYFHKLNQLSFYSEFQSFLRPL